MEFFVWIDESTQELINYRIENGVIERYDPEMFFETGSMWFNSSYENLDELRSDASLNGCLLLELAPAKVSPVTDKLALPTRSEEEAIQNLKVAIPKGKVFGDSAEVKYRLLQSIPVAGVGMCEWSR